MSTRIVQLQKGLERRVALVVEPDLHLLSAPSYYHIVMESLRTGLPVTMVLKAARSGESLEYDPIYNDQSDWKLLPPLTHIDPAHCLISGTGLTHLGSAKDRDSMHEKHIENQKSKIETDLTDSMKMFRWGLEGGKPAAGHIGIAPEWFFKGSGANLRAHGERLDVPTYAQDGGEEAEIVGLYIIDKAGNPLRVGMAQGNEFSDHVFEKKNYLNLAGSKLRTCSIGPELVINPDFSTIPGEVSILRPVPQASTPHSEPPAQAPTSQPEFTSLWSKKLATGESEMSHSLANIEHHHFKFEAHRRPGDVHIHYLGTSALSFGEGIRLQDGDIMQVHFENFGRPLRNPLHTALGTEQLIAVRTLL